MLACAACHTDAPSSVAQGMTGEIAETGDDESGAPTADPCDPALADPAAAHTVAMLSDHWGWADGVALYGLSARIARGDDPEALAAVQGWVDGRLDEGFVLTHVNQMAPGWALLALHARTGDPRYLDEAEALAEHFVSSHPRSDDGAWLHAGQSVWVDTMFMGPAFLAELSAVTGDLRWRDEAMLQLERHAAWLWSDAGGLYQHGAPTIEVTDPDAVPPPVHWGRGNAWAALATAEVLARTSGGPGREALEARLEAHLEALAALQDPGGGWRTRLDVGDSYLESSATAGLARAFRLGAQLELVDPAAADAIVGDACRYLEDRAEAGRLRGVSGSTAYGIEPHEYDLIAGDEVTPWGQGLWLALLEGPTPR